MFGELHKGQKSDIMPFGRSFKYMISPHAMAADKRIRTTGGKEEDVHTGYGLLGYLSLLSLLGLLGLLSLLDYRVIEYRVKRVAK